MSDVAQLIAADPVVVFATSTCPFCHQAIQALESSGHAPKVVIVNSDQRADLRSKTGVTSVPSIWVKGTYIGGMNDGPESWMGLRKCLNSGKFTELLGK